MASFFVSRVDTEVDRRLEKAGEQAAGLEGKAAVAQAKLAYRLFQERFSGPRWEALAARGAHLQRPLWASTSTKNPAYPDLLYVDSLIGPHTVNTMPDATVAAFVDHGTVARTVDTDVAEAEAAPRARLQRGRRRHGRRGPRCSRTKGWRRSPRATRSCSRPSTTRPTPSDLHEPTTGRSPEPARRGAPDHPAGPTGRAGGVRGVRGSHLPQAAARPRAAEPAAAADPRLRGGRGGPHAASTTRSSGT